MEKKLKIIGVLVIIISFITLSLVFIYIIKTKKCYIDNEQIKITSVYYSPDSFGGYEHWTGKGVFLSTGSVYFYEVFEPVEVGDILIKKTRYCE